MLGGADWGFEVRPPPGWRARQNAEGAILGHDSIAGAIIIKPHEEPSLARVKSLLTDPPPALGVTPKGPVRKLSATAYGGEFEGVVNGTPGRSFSIGTYSKKSKRGAWIFAMSTNEGFSGALRDAAKAVAKRLRYLKAPKVDGLMKHFAGKWSSRSGKLFLAKDGTFGQRSELVASGKFKNYTSGVETGTWGVANAKVARGRWRAVGTKRAGQIVISEADGSTRTIRYRVHVEHGKTYWHEYFFNGVLHGR